MRRIVSNKPIWCEHCGHIYSGFITYDIEDDSGIEYCSYCTHANGDIDEAQLKIDELDDLKMYKTYLIAEMRNVDEKIAEFFGHTLDKE